MSENRDDVTPLLDIGPHERHELLVTYEALRTLPPRQVNREPHRRTIKHNPREED